MPRPVTLALSAVCAGLIGLAAMFFFKKDKPSIAAQPRETESLVNPPAVVDAGIAPGPTAPLKRAPAPARPPETHAADEASLLSQLHELAGSDPERSLTLAREAVNRFPDSPNAPEFEWNVVKALFNLRRLDDAKAEARIMLSKYPGSSFTGDVVHHLLNPPPNPPDVPQ